MAGTGFGPFTAMGDGRYGVEKHGAGLWRAVACDDCGSWAVTGPPMRTKTEAMAYWLSDGRLALYFGDAA